MFSPGSGYHAAALKYALALSPCAMCHTPRPGSIIAPQTASLHLSARDQPEPTIHNVIKLRNNPTQLASISVLEHGVEI